MLVLSVSLLFPDLLIQWEGLHGLASDRHQQAHQLSVINEAIGSIKKELDASSKTLNFKLFASKEELEDTINTLRVRPIKKNISTIFRIYLWL